MNINQWIGDHGYGAMDDRVFIRSIPAMAKLGNDAWGRDKPQPVEISVTLNLSNSVEPVAETDDVTSGGTVHYGLLSKRITAAVESISGSWMQPGTFADLILNTCVEKDWEFIASVELEFRLPKALKFGSGVTFKCYDQLKDNCQLFRGGHDSVRTLLLEGICVPAIVGVNAYEREAKQPVALTVQLDQMTNWDENDSSDIEQIVFKARLFHSFDTSSS